MAVIEYDSYKQKLLAMSDTFENLQKALDIESSKHEIARLEAEAHEDGFWNDIERSQANQMRTKQLQNKVHRFEKLVSTRDDLLALIDMGNEMDDASLLPELEEGFADLEKRIEEVRLTTLLSGEYDNCNAILTFHAGAGGTEAQDWTQMLYRMYTQLGEQARLRVRDDGLSRRRRGRHQERDGHGQGRERLRLSQERERRPPSGARFPL